ncbi:MAG: LytR C-terminal domain-containing protein [Gemmatimonadota bacterium]|nr:MAG: LytR C-terminal domain-containing protein [Gemmatimonadota bacterium]
MRDRIRGIVVALLFAIVGAFLASLWLEIRRETPAAQLPPAGLWEGRSIRVEVLNGVGVRDLALRATDRLRDQKFDVVYYGNAADFERDSSVAIARLDKVEPARRVADALGLRHVVHEPDRNLYLDVTVILGSDWLEARGETGKADARGLSLWWGRVKRAARRLWPG